MSDDSDQSAANQEGNCCYGERGPRRALRWLRTSFSEPDNLPLHLTWLFTVVLAVFAYGAWREAVKGTLAIQGQLDAMRSEQRPWARVDIHTANFPPFDPTGDPRGVAAIPISSTITSAGHAPLFGAKARSWPFIVGTSGEDFFVAWKKDCAKFRTEDREDPWDQGALLFPGDSFTDGNLMVGPKMPGIILKTLDKVKKWSDGKRVVAIYVYGCVNYSFTAGVKSTKPVSLFG
jgi:hypothetical protein